MNKLLPILLMVFALAFTAFGQNSASTYIRQLPQSGFVCPDTTVGPNGTGNYVSPVAITELNTFQLWAQRISPPDWTLIQTLSLSPYDPTWILSVASPDTVLSNRTRVDIPYTVNYTVVFPTFTGKVYADTVLRTGVDLYNSTGIFNWIPNIQPDGGSWYVTNAATIIWQPQTNTISEHWWLDRQQVNGSLYRRYAEIPMRIIPKHTVGYTGAPPPRVVNASVLNTVINITNLYPTSSSHLLIKTPNNPTGMVSNDLSQNVTDPYPRTITVPWTSALTVPGTYSAELWTWTSIAGWEQIPLVPPISFLFDPEIKLNADIYVN